MALGDLVSTLSADPSAASTFAYGSLSDVQRRQLMAQQLMNAGSSTAPIQSRWQGAARLFQGIQGGLEAGELESERRKGVAADPGASAMVAELMKGQNGTPASPTTKALGDAVASYDPDAPAGSVSPGVSNFLPTFAKVAGGYGVTPDYLARTAQIESQGNPNAHNASGADGLFQFMPKTASAYGLTDTRDPVASTHAAAALASDNRASLASALGRDPTDAELYLAHQQGAGGAAKLLANPNAPAASVVGMKAVTQNGGTPDMTAGQFAGLWTNKYNQTPGVQVASNDPTQAMSFVGSQGATPGGAAIDAASAPLPPPRPAEFNVPPVQRAAGLDPYSRASTAGPPTSTTPMQAASDVSTGPQVHGSGAPGTASADDDETPAPTPASASGSPTQLPAVTASPPTTAGTPSARPMLNPRVSPDALRMAMSALGNPYASQASQQVARQIVAAAFTKPDGPIAVAAGSSVYDPTSGKLLFTAPKDQKDDKTATQKDYEFYSSQARAAGQQPMPFDTWSTAKARAAATNVTTNVDTKAGDTYDQQLAQGLGKAHAALSNGVEDAQARARDLAAMQNAVDAIQKNGGSTGGMGASQALDVQKTINAGANALGFSKPFDEKDLSDKEFLTKFNRQIAGQMAKGAVGGRVTNFEMANYLKANPGLEMTLTGNQRLIGIQSQIEQRNVEVGNSIREATASAISRGQKINPMQVQKILTDYDNSHHVMDPLTGQDLTQNVRLPEFQNGGTGGGGTSTGTSSPARPRMKFNPATGGFDG